MQKILLVEPDARLREWGRLHLTTLGYSVTVMGDNQRALEFVRNELPDLTLLATDSPGISAFALAAAIRSGQSTAHSQIVFLVPGDDAGSLAQAQAIDPQAALTKPLSRPVLLEAVLSRLSRADAARAARAAPTPARPAAAAPASTGGTSGLLVEAKDASVLVVVLRNLVSLARSMRARTLEILIERFADDAREVILASGGWCIRADASGLTALFEDGPHADRSHAARAVESALRIALTARRVKRWADTTLSDVHIPPLSVGCGVHSGEIIVTRLSVSGHLSPSIAGQTADIALRLNGRAKGLGWSVAASESAAFLAGSRFKFGRRATLTDTDHGVTIPVIEVLGFNPGTARPGELPLMAEVREAVLASAVLSRLAGDAAPAETDKTIIVTMNRGDTDPFPEIPQRRIARRLRQSDHVLSYVSMHVPTDREEIVRTIALDTSPPELVDAYLEDYRLLSGLEQRNVLTIYEVGRTPSLAYVAAEWLGGGTLTEAIRSKLPVGLALNYLAQMCFAVDAVHGIGLPHGALHSGHFMLREDGVVVLADFNVQQRALDTLSIARAAPEGASQTPPRATGDDAATIRRDFRSLGLVLQGMLTADPTLAQTSNDISGPTLEARTRLPIELSPLQPILDGLLGVGDQRPIERAEEVLVELLGLREVFPFDIRSGDAGRAGDLA